MSDPFIIDSGPSERGWSYYAKFLRCPMLFYWKHVYADTHGFGWSDYTHPLARGTLVHVGLAHYYARMWATQNGRDPNSLIKPLEAVKVKARQIGELGEAMYPVVEKMLAAYWRRYPTETFRVVAVEDPKRIMFGPALYTARLDLAVEEADGKVYIYDTKTTRRFESKTIRKYTLHGQFFGQHYIGREFWGDRFGGVVVNAIDEEGECFRRRPDPAPLMLRRFPAIVESHHHLIESAKATLGDSEDAWASIAHPDEQICFGPYGQCPAFEFCRWGHGG